MLADKVKIGYLTQEFEVKGSNTVREEFMSSFGEESKVLADTERIQKALEDEPSMELMTILLEKLDELQRKAERLDLFNMERAIDKIMPSLGFVPEDNDRLVASFSGGWQMRISLGKILLQEPGLLLMDEPTNHLDLDAIQWLEEYLKSVDVPMVIVSHDREFLDQLCTKTVEVERGRATTYKGNYSDYQRQKASGSAQQMVAYEKYMKEVTRQKEMIRRLSGGGQSGRANAAAKELQRLEEDPVEKPWSEKTRRFQFPDAPRSSAVVARVENLTHGYDEKTLFKNTNLQIDRGERVAMIGANGCGKSTLMRLIQGREEPLGGIAEFGSEDLCLVNYFYQNQAEGLDTNKGVLQTLVEAAPDEGLNDLKALLGRMKFSTSFHNKPVKFLSGGEKARLAPPSSWSPPRTSCSWTSPRTIWTSPPRRCSRRRLRASTAPSSPSRTIVTFCDRLRRACSTLTRDASPITPAITRTSWRRTTRRARATSACRSRLRRLRKSKSRPRAR